MTFVSLFVFLPDTHTLPFLSLSPNRVLSLRRRLYLLIQCHRWRSIIRPLLLSIPFSRHFILTFSFSYPLRSLSGLLLWCFYYIVLSTLLQWHFGCSSFLHGKTVVYLIGLLLCCFSMSDPSDGFWIIWITQVQQKHCANIFLVIWLFTLDLVVNFLLFSFNM